MSMIWVTLSPVEPVFEITLTVDELAGGSRQLYTLRIDRNCDLMRELGKGDTNSR